MAGPSQKSNLTMNNNENAIYEELYNAVKNDYSPAIEAQTAVWEHRKPTKQPLLLCAAKTEEQLRRFPSFTPSEVHYDRTKMLLNGMGGMVCAANGGMEAVPSIRANMGCGIFASLFPGILPMLFEDGKMPWVINHLSHDNISNLSEKDIVITDEFKTALEHMAYQADKIEGTGAFVFPLDLQGPFDLAHIVYGDAFFYDLYDEPDLMHRLLSLCCYAIELGVDECLKIMPSSNEYIAHYNSVIIPRSLGGFKISEDTSTLVSAEHIDEFVIPYTSRILKYTNGGYIHYCGRNDYLLSRVLKHPLVYGLNFGNPEKHDMEEVLRQTAKAGKVFYGECRRFKDETETDYFERVLRAATTSDGLCNLLLSYYCDEAWRQSEVQAAWESACARAERISYLS